MRPDELGRRTPTTVFFDRALLTSKLRYHRNHQTKDQRTHAKSSKSLGKCYKPISYSMDIQCYIIGHRLLLTKRVIGLLSRGGRDMRYFYWFGLDIPTNFCLHNCDRYLSYHGYHWSMPSFRMWLLSFSNRGICRIITEQSPRRDKVLQRGAHVCTTFGKSPRRDKFL
jgi:hypothetical protein